MTTKQEANRIANRFYQGSVFDYDKEGHLKERKKAKERALICVDEMEKIQFKMYGQDKEFTLHYMEVKEEINKL
jgi:hypothetical protein